MPLAFIILYAFTTRGAQLRSSRRRATRCNGSPSPGAGQDVWDALGLSIAVAAALDAASRSSSARSPRRRWRARSSSAARRSRCSSSCRSRCPASSPASRCARPSTSTDIPFSFWTIVLGHATFCIVVVYNNAVARFRRLSPSLVEASMDLGADGFQTFRHVVLPNHRHGAARRRHARLRAVLRRGDRHHLHRRPADRRCRSGCCPS